MTEFTIYCAYSYHITYQHDPHYSRFNYSKILIRVCTKNVTVIIHFTIKHCADVNKGLRSPWQWDSLQFPVGIKTNWRSLGVVHSPAGMTQILLSLWHYATGFSEFPTCRWNTGQYMSCAELIVIWTCEFYIGLGLIICWF